MAMREEAAIGNIFEDARNADVDRGTATAASAASDTGQRVVELDGTRVGPVDRGVCTDLLEVRLF
jgi:hypothetical protein